MMTITASAAEMIRKQLRRSEVRNPVVFLVQMSAAPPEVVEALRVGASQKVVAEIHERVSGRISLCLFPAIYPRSQCLWIFTTTIAGFPFASSLLHPRYARDAMKTGTLDLAEKGLALRDSKGTIVMPRAPHSAL